MPETCMITFSYEGKERRANVQQLSAADNIFLVTLDDGYENIFVQPEETPYTWYEKSIGYTELARSVGKAISNIFCE
jgi:hypothetical protein